MPPAYRRVWLLLALIAGAASAVPLWCSHFLPYQDAPQHLAAIHMLAGHDQAARETLRFFDVGFARAQYTGFYLPAVWLARFLGADGAIRALLTFFALLTPVSAWIFLRSFGRDPRLAVFAPALFHSAPLYIGIYNFVAAVPVALLVIALVERELRAPSRLRAALLAPLALWLLYLHVSGFLVACAASSVLALTSAERRGRLVRALAPLLPALALLGWFALHPTATGSVPVDVASLPRRPAWQSPIGQVHDLLRFLNVFPGRLDELFAFLLFAAVVALWREKADKPLPARAWRLPFLAAGLFAVFLAMPIELGYIAYIHLRAMPFILLFALAAIPVARTRRAARLLGAVCALQLVYAAVVVQKYRAFDREANGAQLARVLADAQPGRRLVSLMLHRKSKAVHFEPYLHFGVYYEVLRGGRVRYNFGELPWMPLRFKREPAARPFPLRWEFDAGLFDWRLALGDADYVLVRTSDPDPDGDVAEDPEPGPEFASGWELAAEEGRWRLFRPASRRSGEDARDDRDRAGLPHEALRGVDDHGAARLPPDRQVRP